MEFLEHKLVQRKNTSLDNPRLVFGISGAKMVDEPLRRNGRSLPTPTNPILAIGTGVLQVPTLGGLHADSMHPKRIIPAEKLSVLTRHKSAAN